MLSHLLRGSNRHAVKVASAPTRNSFEHNRIQSFNSLKKYKGCLAISNQRMLIASCRGSSATVFYLTERKLSANRHRDDDREDPEKKSKTGIIASAAVGASFLLGKTKYAFAALKLTKAAPMVSMVLTSFTYSLFFGWPYAVGMVGLIFCHECGHAVVMRHYGVPFSPMVFIPFMGAVIAMKEQPRNSYQEAMIALGGPVSGSVAALALSGAGTAMDSQLMFALADFGFMINLFNLLPIGSMDGGRIGSAVSPYFGVAGLATGGGLIYAGMVTNPIFYLIMLSGTWTTGKRLFGEICYPCVHTGRVDHILSYPTIQPSGQPSNSLSKYSLSLSKSAK